MTPWRVTRNRCFNEMFLNVVCDKVNDTIQACNSQTNPMGDEIHAGNGEHETKHITMICGAVLNHHQAMTVARLGFMVTAWACVLKKCQLYPQKSMANCLDVYVHYDKCWIISIPIYIFIYISTTKREFLYCQLGRSHRRLKSFTC